MAYQADGVQPESIEILDDPTQILARLREYDYTKIKVGIIENAETLKAGVRREELCDHSPVNRQCIIDMQNELNKVGAVILTGAYAMGKSTIGHNWSENPPAGEVRDFHDHMGGKFFVEGQEGNDITGIFLDEVGTGGDGDISEVLTLIEMGKKVIVSTDLRTSEIIVKRITDEGIPIQRVFVEPSDIETLCTYISQELSIDESDELARLIASLSGGSVKIAGKICEEIRDQIFYGSQNLGNSEFCDSFIRNAKGVSDSDVRNWDYQRTITPEHLHRYIPSPLLAKINIYA